LFVWTWRSLNRKFIDGRASLDGFCPYYTTNERGSKEIFIRMIKKICFYCNFSEFMVQ